MKNHPSQELTGVEGVSDISLEELTGAEASSDISDMSLATELTGAAEQSEIK